MGNRRFVLVAVDYFTKWAEAEALANIRDVDVKKFIWKNIITRFRVLDSLISDNGLQFDSRAFCEFYSNLDIRNIYFSPAYPQSNGQAEVVNKVIMNSLKRRLEVQRVTGPRNYPMFCGNTGQLLGGLRGRPHSLSRMGRRP